MLSVEDLHAAYGTTPALRGATLTVHPMEVVSVIGRNGVGKSTLMRTIVGLLPVGSGRLLLGGEDVTRLSAHDRVQRGIGYVPQGRMIFPDLTVEENLLMGADLDRSRTKRQMEEVLAGFPRLRERYRQRGGTLSGGEQQLLALARGLVGRPRLLLLDEPSAGIQPSIVQEIEERLAAVNRAQGITILLVEQNIEFAAVLAHRIYVMEKGRIAREIAPQDVMNEEIMRAYLAV